MLQVSILAPLVLISLLLMQGKYATGFYSGSFGVDITTSHAG